MDFISKNISLIVSPFIKRRRLQNIVLGAIDVMAITLAFQVAYYLEYYWIDRIFINEKNFLILYLFVLPFWLSILYFTKVTEIPRTKRNRVLLFEYFQSALIIGGVLLVIYFIFKMSWISRLFLIYFTLLGFIFLFCVRFVEYKIFRAYRAKGYNYVNIVIIADDSSLAFIDSLMIYKEWGYRIFAIVTGSKQIIEKYEKEVIILPEEFVKVLNDLMEVDIVDEVLYVKAKVVSSEVRNVIRSCEELGVVFRLKYDDKELNLSNAVKTNIGDKKFLSFINIPHNPYALMLKNITDITVSLFMIVLLSPVLITISLMIKIASPGPILFTQKRVGLRGRHFNLYKFRTMVVDAEKMKKDLESENEVDGPVFKIKDDPRVTNIGKFLRKTGLDELPQLFNILKGEMSLIGPRPPLPSETQQYKRWQLRRLSIKPGLSCFWQIQPDRNSIKFEQWMEMDLAYIDNWSLRLDLVIFIKTIRTVFMRSGL